MYDYLYIISGQPTLRTLQDIKKKEILWPANHTLTWIMPHTICMVLNILTQYPLFPLPGRLIRTANW